MLLIDSISSLTFDCVTLFYFKQNYWVQNNMLPYRWIQTLTWHVSRNFNMYTISTQRVWIKVKICSYQRHANKGGLDTCCYGVHVSNIYVYFSIIIIIIKNFDIFFISHFF